MDITGLLGGMAAAAIVAGAWGVAAVLKRRRRGRFAVYGVEMKTFHLPDDGTVHYAQWLHPKEAPKPVEQSDVTALRRFVREGDLVIDIGAHTGDTTVPLGLAAGKKGCTLALEPNPYVFDVLKQNAELNRDKTNIVPLCFAATETDGTFTFHYSDGAYCNGGFLSQIKDQRHGHRQPLDVQGRNLEQFLRREYGSRLKRLSYIKTDTEGYDRQVLQSIRGILEEFRPVIVCEVLGRLVQEEREALFDLLESCGYDCYKRESTSELQGPRLLRDSMTQWKHFDVLAIPRTKLKVAAA